MVGRTFEIRVNSKLLQHLDSLCQDTHPLGTIKLVYSYRFDNISVQNLQYETVGINHTVYCKKEDSASVEIRTQDRWVSIEIFKEPTNPL